MKKKHRIWIYLILLTGLLLLIHFSCKKGDVIKVTPTITITAVTNITATSAASGGNITSDGGAAITSRGLCWCAGQNPTTANSKVSGGIGTGSFTSTISGLAPGTHL